MSTSEMLVVNTHGNVCKPFWLEQLSIATAHDRLTIVLYSQWSGDRRDYDRIVDWEYGLKENQVKGQKEGFGFNDLEPFKTNELAEKVAHIAHSNYIRLGLIRPHSY